MWSKLKGFYVYEHWRPDTNECFYVGKGRTRRGGKMTDRGDYHKRIQAKLKDAGLSLSIVIVADGLSEKEAHALEIERIAHWKAIGHAHCNFTIGGEGSSGSRHTDEWKRAASERFKGKPRPPHVVDIFRRPKSEEHKEKLRQARLGKKFGPEARANMKAAQQNRPPHSEETKAKMSASQKGRKKSEQHLENIREAAKKRIGVPQSPEAIEKRRLKQIGRKATPETIEKLKASFTPERLASVSKKLKGVPKSEEHRRKIGEAHKGKTVSASSKAKISASWTPERRAAQSELAKQQRAREALMHAQNGTKRTKS